MSEQEIAALLVFLNELDGRHSPNEIKVRAWKEVFDSAAPMMHVSFAKSVAQQHYALLDDMITPSVFVRAWGMRQQGKEAFNEEHCRRRNCGCSHQLCFRGWIDREDGKTAPCGICRAELHMALADMPPAGQRSDQDWARFRLRGVKADA